MRREPVGKKRGKNGTKAVNEKGLISFAAEKVPQQEVSIAAKVLRPLGELKRNEKLGYGD